MKTQLTLIVAFMCAISLPLSAAENGEASEAPAPMSDNIFYQVFRGFSISPGVSVKSPTFGVTRKSDDYAARITASPGTFGFELDIAFRDFDVPGTPLGVTLFSHSGTFRTYKQFDDNPADKEMKNIGTSISGWYTYMVPAIYYIRRDPDKVARLGGGIGYGGVKFEGDIVLTPDGIIPPVRNPTKVSGSSLNAFAYMVFYDLRFDNGWAVRVAVGGPRFQDANYKYEMDEFNITVSRAFTLLK